MQVDYVYNSDGITSTYLDDKENCFKQNGNDKRYIRIETAIYDASSYTEIKNKYEIKQLDSNTKLMELKCSKIRVIHFLFEGNKIVLLGTFIKDKQKTPKSEIDKNNKRIEKYKIAKSEE